MCKLMLIEANSTRFSRTTAKVEFHSHWHLKYNHLHVMFQLDRNDVAPTPMLTQKYTGQVVCIV